MNNLDAQDLYDFIIIGAGPIGMTLGIECEKNKLKYLIIEKGTLVNSLYHFPTEMTYFSTSQLLEIGNVPFVSHHYKPTRKESLEYYRRVSSEWKLNIHFYETYHGLSRENEHYIIETDKTTYRSKAVVFATGFFDTPRLLEVPGEELDKVKHYYTDVHPYVNQKVIVVGSANSACDVALELFHRDCDVTMVIRESEISPKVKYWIRPNIINRIKDGDIKAHFQSQIVAIHPKEVEIETPRGKEILQNDFVLAMTGYKPKFEMFLDAGIKQDPNDPNLLVIDSETFETNLPQVYIAGVAVAGMYTSKLFIENTRHHANQIVRDFLSKN